MLTRDISDTERLMSPVVHWLALWFRNPYVAGSNPAEDGQGYELFGEIALKNRGFFLFITILL